MLFALTIVVVASLTTHCEQDRDHRTGSSVTPPQVHCNLSRRICRVSLHKMLHGLGKKTAAVSANLLNCSVSQSLSAPNSEAISAATLGAISMAARAFKKKCAGCVEPIHLQRCAPSHAGRPTGLGPKLRVIDCLRFITAGDWSRPDPTLPAVTAVDAGWMAIELCSIDWRSSDGQRARAAWTSTQLRHLGRAIDAIFRHSAVGRPLATSDGQQAVAGHFDRMIPGQAGCLLAGT